MKLAARRWMAVEKFTSFLKEHVLAVSANDSYAGVAIATPVGKGTFRIEDGTYS